MVTAFTMIHHASKGLQADKQVTDVGSGAGAEFRAADTHLILRHHEEQDVYVLDAVARSWPSNGPELPALAIPAVAPCPGMRLGQASTTQVRGTAAEKAKEPPPDAKSFVEAYVSPEQQPQDVICSRHPRPASHAPRPKRYSKDALALRYAFARQEHGSYGRKLIATVPPN